MFSVIDSCSIRRTYFPILFCVDKATPPSYFAGSCTLLQRFDRDLYFCKNKRENEGGGGGKRKDSGRWEMIEIEL